MHHLCFLIRTRPLSHTSVVLHISVAELKRGLWNQRRPCRGLRHHWRTNFPTSLSLYPILPGLSLATAEAWQYDAWIHRRFLSFLFLCCLLSRTYSPGAFIVACYSGTGHGTFAGVNFGHVCMCFDAAVVTPSSIRYTTPANISTLWHFWIASDQFFFVCFLQCPPTHLSLWRCWSR